MRASDQKVPQHNVTGLVDALLERSLAAGATDLHFEPVDGGLLVRVRVDGQLVDQEMLPRTLHENVVSRLKVLASLLTYRIDIPQEGSVLWQGGPGRAAERPVDLRVATFPTIRGERTVVRLFRDLPQLQSLEALGFAADQAATVRAALDQPGGLIVLSGPAGSGKTTTLYSMVRELRDRHAERSIITLEDPVEQRIDRVTQIQINPHGELSYERCMRSLLRQDPQVILLGEVRDRNTALLGIEAALTGHLILTTVHSGDPAETIVRFLEMEIPPYQLASVLSVVCSQRLVRRICDSCRGAEASSCDHCLRTGYSGRTAIAHAVRVDEELRAMILQHPPASQLRRWLAEQGPDLLVRAAGLVSRGITDEDEVARVLGQLPRTDLRLAPAGTRRKHA